MCKLHKLKDATFTVYYIVNENYVGVTYQLKKRLIKHKSKSNFDVSDVKILLNTKNLNEALECELHFQNKLKCQKGVRNQEGNKNPYAKQVLHLTTGIYFDTIKEAANCLGFNYSAARQQVLKDNNKYNLIKLN